MPGQVYHQVGGNFLISVSGPSIPSSVNKELPADYFKCLPPDPYFLSLPFLKGNGSCLIPSNKSLQRHREVAFVTVLVLLVALSPPWNQRGFPGLKTRKKQNGNEFYQPVDKRNSPSQSGLHFGNEASTVFLQSPLASCLQINWRCNHNLPGWILAHHFETAKLERDFS